jgi:hypothetical protein
MEGKQCIIYKLVFLPTLIDIMYRQVSQVGLFQRLEQLNIFSRCADGFFCLG